jgi:carbonic anhydrase
MRGGARRTALVGAVALIGLVAAPALAQTGSSAASVPAANTVAAPQLQRLLNGNRRYVADRSRRPNDRPTGGAQFPFAALVACSDARVPPEILFDQGVNDLFVVRIAGNTVDDPATAHPALIDSVQLQSLAFAVEVLKVPLIVVLGHDQCGAVRGAIQKCGMASIGPMFQNICPAVRDASAATSDPMLKLRAAVANNIKYQVKVLRSTPPFADMAKQGRLRIVGALANMNTGRVTVIVP